MTSNARAARTVGPWVRSAIFLTQYSAILIFVGPYVGHVPPWGPGSLVVVVIVAWGAVLWRLTTALEFAERREERVRS